MWSAYLAMEKSVFPDVRNYAADGLSSAPLGDWYETTNGGPEGFRARPVVGGHLALVRQNSPSFNSAKAHAELAARCVSERCYETFLPLTFLIDSMYYIVLVPSVFAVIHRSRLQTQRTHKQRVTIPPQAWRHIILFSVSRKQRQLRFSWREAVSLFSDPTNDCKFCFYGRISVPAFCEIRSIALQ